MRIVFMGTPEFAVPSLRVLLDEGYEVCAVVTQPDRPKGRKRVLTAPPVKEEALRHGIPVLQPERMRRPEAVAEVAAYEPDLIVTAAYGQILPKSLLDLPRYGCLNVHGSLLPKYRGGAPIQHAILNGEKVTGVTIMYMAEGLDTGDMISRIEVPIEDQDTTGTMFAKLSEAGAKLLRETLPGVLAGTIEAVPQNEAKATVAPNLKREDERIDWSRPAEELYNQIRGLNPWPVAFTLWNGEVFKVWSSRMPEESALKTEQSPAYGGGAADAGANGGSSIIGENAGQIGTGAAGRPAGTIGEAAVKAGAADQAVPGTVLRSTGGGIEVQTGRGTLWLTEVQPAGKKAMDAAVFNRGGGIPAGTVLGS